MNCAQWAEFAVALLVFAASHFLPRWGGWREMLIITFGRRTYFAGYGLISLVVLVWLITAAGRAPFVELWPAPDWTRKVPNVVMPLALWLAVVAVKTWSPFTLGSKRDIAFDPSASDPSAPGLSDPCLSDPGLSALTRHPLLWALALWSGAHLPPNGDLAHVILFGGFAAVSLAAMPLFDHRARLVLGACAAGTLFRAAPVLSLQPLFDPTWMGTHWRALVWRVAGAAAIWAIVLALHGTVIGVSPLP